MSARAAFSYLTISAVETYGFLSRAHSRVRPYDFVILYPVKQHLDFFYSLRAAPKSRSHESIFIKLESIPQRTAANVLRRR